MATNNQRDDGWATVLRRQPAHIVDGRAEGPCTGAFEIICGGCGDDPGREYAGVSPRLQLVRGPYPIGEGIAAYQAHLGVHGRAAAAGGPGAMADAG